MSDPPNFDDSFVSQEEAAEAIEMLTDHCDEAVHDPERFKSLILTAILSIDKRIRDLEDQIAVQIAELQKRVDALEAKKKARAMDKDKGSVKGMVSNGDGKSVGSSTTDDDAPQP